MGLLNRRAVRDYVLEFSRLNRHHRFSRVGKDVYEKVEGELKLSLQALVLKHPSKGKTIRTK